MNKKPLMNRQTDIRNGHTYIQTDTKRKQTSNHRQTNTNN